MAGSLGQGGGRRGGHGVVPPAPKGVDVGQEQEGVAGGAGVGPLTQHLQWWLRHITPSEERGLRGFVHWILTVCRGNTFTMAACSVDILLACLDLILDYTNSSKFQMRYVIGVYSTLFAQYIWRNRLATLTGALEKLVDLLHPLEYRAHPKSQERMRCTARRSGRLIRFFATYSVMSELFVPVLFVVLQQAWPAAVASAVLRPLPESIAESVHPFLANAMRWVAFLLQLVSMFSCIHSFYTLIVCLLVLYGAAGDLFDAMGRGLEAAPCSAGWPRLQSELLRVLVDLDAGLADLMPHLILISVVLPLLSTVEVMAKGTQADVFAVLMAPLILMVFVPQCLAGDALSVARQGVVERAAAGPWPEEAPWQQRLRRGVMQASLGRGARLRGRGIGLLDRRACHAALKSWFSFLQVLINVEARNG